MDIVRFADAVFQVTPSTIRAVESLKITAETDTNNASANQQAYVTKKEGKPAQITFTVFLSASLGVDVEADLERLLEYARDGRQDYLLIGGRKIIGSLFMLTKCEATDIAMTPGGMLSSCKVNLTMKQAGPNDGSPIAPGAPSKKKKPPAADDDEDEDDSTDGPANPNLQDILKKAQQEIDSHRKQTGQKIYGVHYSLTSRLNLQVAGKTNSATKTTRVLRK